LDRAGGWSWRCKAAPSNSLLFKGTPEGALFCGACCFTGLLP
jgi:hypothetical protein